MVQTRLLEDERDMVVASYIVREVKVEKEE